MRTAKYLIGDNKVELYGYIHEDQAKLEGCYGKRPCIIVCPGGAYKLLAPREEDPVVFPLFSHGYNVFVLKYSIGEQIKASWPEAEAAMAIRAIREDSGKLNTDPDSIFIMGFSAGGHVAASIACHWKRYGELSKPNAAVLCYPVLTMGKNGHAESTMYLTGGDERLKAYYSLETQVDDDTSPCFIWHTITDASVPYRPSVEFSLALEEHGVECELHLYARGRHGLSTGYGETGVRERCVQSWMDLCFTFLDTLCDFEK